MAKRLSTTHTAYVWWSKVKSNSLSASKIHLLSTATWDFIVRCYVENNFWILCPLLFTVCNSSLEREENTCPTYFISQTIEYYSLKIFTLLYQTLLILFHFILTVQVAIVQSLFVSDPLRPNELHHARLHCPSLLPRVCSNSCPLSRWYYLTISSSITSFSFCHQSFPALGSFLMSWLHIRWATYWSFNFNIGPSNEIVKVDCL